MSPKQKALLSVLSIIVGSALGAFVVMLSIVYGVFAYLGYAIVIYAIISLLKIVYDMKLVQYTEEQKHQNY